MLLEEAKKIVFEKKPAFAEFYYKYKDQKWNDYIENNYYKTIQNNKIDELLITLDKIITPLIGKASSEKAQKTIKETGFVSTCDHSGILCHPFFSNIALARKNFSKEKHSVICFTCGGVSMTNSSYPRGVFFHDKNLNLKKIPLISLRNRRRSVYGTTSFSKHKIQKILNEIETYNIDEDSKARLKRFFALINNNQNIFELEKFSDQITVVNKILWEEIFGQDDNELIYIEAENIVRHLLLDIHLANDSVINKILFNPQTRNLYIKNFENIIGAHNTLSQSGSHFFWYIDEIENTRKQLFLKGEMLVSVDEKIKIPFLPEILREYLLRYELLPTMAFCYSILSFYYGLTLGGGFSQIKYLGDIKDAWANTVLGDEETLEKTDTNIFAGEFVLLGLSNGEQVTPASLIDLLLYSNNPKEDVDTALKECSIGDTIDAMMDEFLEIITGQKEQISDTKIHKTLNV